MNKLDLYKEKLRSTGLRPTKQRVSICKVLFDPKATFHFTIEKLKKLIEQKLREKISLATIYNTVNAFKAEGYLKEIPIEGNKSFYDTNVSHHHHFFDQENGKLTDINKKDISVKNIPCAPKGKKIKTVNVMVIVASDNHNQE